MHRGYIKIWRKILDNSLATKPSYLGLWIYLLLKANHTQKTIVFGNDEIIIKRGQFLTGRAKLSSDIGFAGSTVEDMLNFLEKRQLIRQQKTNKFRIITIINYEHYQKPDSKTDNTPDNKPTTNRQQSDTTNNDNNNKNDKNDKRERQRFAPPALPEVIAFWGEGGKEGVPLKGTPESFFNYFSSNGWRVGRAGLPMKDWHAAARNWAERESGFFAPRKGDDTSQQTIDRIKATVEKYGGK